MKLVCYFHVCNFCGDIYHPIMLIMYVANRYGMHTDRFSDNAVTSKSVYQIVWGKGCILLSIIIKNISQKAFALLDEFKIVLFLS